MDMLSTITARKSTRSYSPEPVGKEKLSLLAQAANSAPKAGPFHITVLTNRAIIAEINEKALAAMKMSGNDFLMSRAAIPGYQPLYGAPVLMLFSAPASNPYGNVTAAAAATAVTFAATAIGLGSCYVVTPTLALNPDAELQRKAGTPEGFSTVCGVLLGFPGEEKFVAEKGGEDNVTFVL